MDDLKEIQKELTEIRGILTILKELDKNQLMKLRDMLKGRELEDPAHTRLVTMGLGAE